MNYYSKDIDNVFKELKSNKNGLSYKEVNKRLEKDGLNKLPSSKKDSKIRKFFKQFNNTMIIILFIASILSFIISTIKKESYLDSIIIIAIVIINAILGYIQEIKADKSLEALKKMQVTKVKVKRENKIEYINSENVVVGDILVLEAGDRVPADARIFWEVSLKVNESSLTGESLPIEKSTNKLPEKTNLAERNNMIYSGTNIVYGKCLAVVCSIGTNTEFGKIASTLISDVHEITPLEEKINEISKYLSIIISVIIIFITIICFVKKMQVVEVIMLSLSLAVAAIPEGLPAVITVILSISVYNMAKKKAIIRKMSSIETLGCTEVICSDKTGTITQNKMTVREVFYDNEIKSLEKIGKDTLLTQLMLLNNDVYKNGNEYIGDPTEIALYNYCEEYMDNVNTFKNKHFRINELPFDSDRKLMTTINHFDNGDKLITKGSFDSLIKKCSKIYENGKINILTDIRKKELKKIEEKESSKAYRVLAFAYKNLTKKYIFNNKIEQDLIFVGMSCMIDPPRIDVKESIQICKKANIKPIMITGDSLQTATSIAKEIGIMGNDDIAMLGEELDKYSDKELEDIVRNCSVYARVSPTNKLNIVKAWKKNNVIVAMTGDGVNDAPALKEANIGVGMGITGTEVTKNVADVILADDSFSTIVSAVGEGRKIFDNIRNVLVYLLAGNIVEVLVVLIGILLSVQIFIPVQLLYINLITDAIPAIALSFEPSADDIMERKVRKKGSSFFNSFMIMKLFTYSFIKTIIIIGLFVLNIKLFGIESSSSMAFLTLILIEILFAYSCKNLKHSILNKNFFSNKILNKSILILIGIQLIVFLTPIKHIFKVVDLNYIQVLLCIGTSLFVLLLDELSKSMVTKLFKDE